MNHVVSDVIHAEELFVVLHVVEFSDVIHVEELFVVLHVVVWDELLA
jgi:hypothetical protein